MLTFEQIKELIDQVHEHQLHGVEIEQSGFRLKIDGHSPPPTVAVAAPAAIAEAPILAAAPAVAVSAPTAQSGSDEGAADGVPPGAEVIHSPIVGTFYSAPSPDADPYVKVGARIDQGQVLCIVEAMKLMNEIEADLAGEIVKVFPTNGQPVEFGEPLFAIRP